MRLWFGVVVALCVAAVIPTSSVAQGKREITPQDAAQFRAIRDARLSPDGKWLVYLEGPCYGTCDDGPVVAVVRSIQGEEERRYEAGKASADAGQLRMSASGSFVAFQFAQSERLGLAVVDLARGTRRDIEAVREFRLLQDDAEQLLLAGYPVAAGRPEFTLVLTTPDGTSVRSIEGVREYALDRAGRRLAVFSVRGLEWLDVGAAGRTPLDSNASHQYSRLIWSPDGSSLAAFRHDEEGTSLVGYDIEGSGRVAPLEVGSSKGSALPEGFELDISLRYFRWRDDGKGFFFGIRPRKVEPKPVAVVSNLSVWHSRDEFLPMERKVRAGAPRVDLCFISFETRRVVRLSDETLAQVEPQGRGEFVLGFDLRPYGWANALRSRKSASQLRDYYLVDLHTGARRPVVKALPVVTRGGGALSILPRLSPDGAFVLFQNGRGDYVSYDVKRGTTRNLTSGLPTRFYFDENQPATGRQLRDNEGQGLPLLQGWSPGYDTVFISDFHDVWALPLNGGRATNVTGNGRRDDIAYSRIALTDGFAGPGSGEHLIDLNEPLYLKAFDLQSGHVGLLRRSPGSPKLISLHWEYADLDLYKSRRAPVFVISRATGSETLDFYAAEADGALGKRLSDVNPAQREFELPPQPRYLTYRTRTGKTRHAILYPPAGSPSGAPYPTSVEIYRGISPSVHTYWAPFTDMGNLKHHGYAVLKPDIIQRLNDAGAAALEDVEAAVEAAVATGIVDRNRLALSGHSYGAYQTHYIVTRTDLFKAAIGYAGMADLYSYCHGIYSGTIPMTALCESDQPYLAGPVWDHADAYRENSPIFHARGVRTPLLLAHGDADEAVPFQQSIEFFNALRRAGNSQVVLLHYRGEPHSFTRPTMADFNERVRQFYDHFLKGKPAPEWWANGRSLYDGQVPAHGSFEASRVRKFVDVEP
jgi:dipeptidyl aminopeptidase/acylaminoacyl peptidase